MIATFVLLVMILVATYTDIRWQKIYNSTTYAGMLSAFALAGLASISGRDEFSQIKIGDSLLGWLVCGLVMLVCFVMFRVGGGDVKLLAMIGAFLGVEAGLQALLWTFVLGAAMVVVILIWKVGVWTLIGRVWRQVVSRMQWGSWEPLSADENQQLQSPLYLAPAALAAVVIVKFSLMSA